MRSEVGILRNHAREIGSQFFTNTSANIIGLFTATLDAVGVQWKAATRATGATNISIARQGTHIGPKY
ncbi:hypothetical protein ACIG5E_30025 [Kitasatospora sp. NPDC053057]|uniref:hypothetical protein n=1 Tax=Kitasatospora sp. NPDC053057 TaxID=3364062 RepID=UPI0037CA869C